VRTFGGGGFAEIDAGIFDDSSRCDDERDVGIQICRNIKAEKLFIKNIIKNIY
jgi:hypothetical protein